MYISFSKKKEKRFTYKVIAYRIIKCAMKGTTKDNIKFHMVGYSQKNGL